MICIGGVPVLKRHFALVDEEKTHTHTYTLDEEKKSSSGQPAPVAAHRWQVTGGR